MEDSILANQSFQREDLMDLCNNQDWLRESVQIEDGEPVEAGLPMRAYSQATAALTGEQNQQLRQQMMVQSMLFTALHQWMQSWDLGAGFDDTYATARRLIRLHLANLNKTQLDTIDRLLVDNDQSGSVSTSNRKQAVVFLSEIFTQKDWLALAEVASHSISSRVLNAANIR